MRSSRRGITRPTWPTTLTCQVVQKIDLQGKGAGPKDENRRRQGIGQPVMTNGRLCVETSEGVKIYGER